MKTNEGTIDRAVRVLAGLVLIALTLTGTIGIWGWIGLATRKLIMCPAWRCSAATPSLPKGLAAISASS